MKHLLSALAFCAALPVCAATLTVNAPATSETLSNDQTVAITNGVSLGVGDTAVFSAKLTMTLPSEAVDRTEQLTDKVAITADKDGTVLVYSYNTETQKWQWQEMLSGFTVADGDELTVEVAVSHEQDADGERANYRVSAWKDAETRARVVYAAPQTAGGLKFAEMELDGEGEATGLAVAAVSQGILPSPTEGGAQDPEVVAKYSTWLNDSSKGGSMPEGATESEISDAFAMNVGGTPKLTITRVSPGTDGDGNDVFTFTMKATYTDKSGTEHDANLADINGMLYVISAETLDGEVTVEAQEMGEATELVAPAGARFAKVSVGFTEPEKTL